MKNLKMTLLASLMLAIGFNTQAMEPNKAEKKGLGLGAKLLELAYNGSESYVADVLRYGEDVNYTDEHGRTALIMVAMSPYSNQNIINLLIQAGARVDHADKAGDTALLTAIRKNSSTTNNVPIVKALIQAGANVNHPNEEGKTPLWLAAVQGDPQVVQELITAGAQINYATPTTKITPLMQATWFGHIEAAQVLLKAGADASMLDMSGNSALWAAAYQRQPKILQLLLTAITALSLHEKDMVKNWLLVNRRLRSEGRGLPRDPQMLAVQAMYRSLAEDLHKRIVQADGLRALEAAYMNGNNAECIQLLKQYLDLNFLTDLVRQQTLLPPYIQAQPRTQYIATPQTYYDLLEIDRNAPPAQIKTAYQRLALRYHPDKAAEHGYTPEQAQKLFIDLKEAYGTLSDPAKRRVYDQLFW